MELRHEMEKLESQLNKYQGELEQSQHRQNPSIKSSLNPPMFQQYMHTPTQDPSASKKKHIYSQSLQQKQQRQMTLLNTSNLKTEQSQLPPPAVTENKSVASYYEQSLSSMSVSKIRQLSREKAHFLVDKSEQHTSPMRCMMIQPCHSKTPTRPPTSGLSAEKSRSQRVMISTLIEEQRSPCYVGTQKAAVLGDSSKRSRTRNLNLQGSGATSKSGGQVPET